LLSTMCRKVRQKGVSQVEKHSIRSEKKSGERLEWAFPFPFERA
jgi:hypothetical protein